MYVNKYSPRVAAVQVNNSGDKIWKGYALELKESNLQSITSQLCCGHFFEAKQTFYFFKKLGKFDIKYSERRTYLNIEEIYSEVYANFVPSGLTLKHD